MSSDTDKIWFDKNLGELEEQFKGQFVAILNEEVITSSADYDELGDTLIKLKKLGRLQGIPLVARASKKNPAAIKIPSF